MTSSTQSNLRTLLFAATAVGALSAYGVCRADTANTAGPATTATADVTATAEATADTTAAAADASSGMVGELVVTAQRRSENIQKVPITIQAFSGQTIAQQNIDTLDDLIKYTPNVTFGHNGPGQGVIFMRGLSAGLQGNQSSATIATFPNVALYLDDQSMQFPARNVDIYTVDLERIEILEGPQGTLFGGGAEAGAVRYITNKPKLDQFEANAEAQYGVTADGGPNEAANLMLNIPIVKDKFAVRLVIYDDHHGGYIDNVPSTFTRSNNDLGNTYFSIHPTGTPALCPNGLPGGGPHDLCALPIAQAPQANNFQLAGPESNPVTYQGGRLEALFQVTDDWNVLIEQSFQTLDAEGISAEYPTGSDFQPLQPLQITSFSPSFDHDSWENTAWTVNGKVGPLKAIYTGGYMDRRIDQQMDYSNYSRSVGGMYYECTGGSTGFGNAPPVCFSPVSNWRDIVRNTHLTNEVRFSTPDDWQFRAIAGVFEEQFRIYDDMNFNYKTIPACTATNFDAGPPCLANVGPAPGSTANDPNLRSDSTAFGEDTQRGYDQTAVFTSIDYDVIPHVLTFTLGTRWYDYNEFLVGSQYETGTGCLDVFPPATDGFLLGQCRSGLTNINEAQGGKGDRVTYRGFKSRANATWHITPDTMTYFTFSQGFRPGGFNRSVSGVADGPGGAGGTGAQFEKPNGYAPDSLDNYEIGLKTALLDHRVTVDLSVYHMNWYNVQLLFFNPTELGNTTFGINGPNYVVNGGEFQVVARPTDQLTIDGSGSYNDDQQTTSPCLMNNIPGTPGFGQCITQVEEKGVGLVPFTNPFGSIGSTPPFSPKFEGDIRARYEWDVLDDYKAHVQVGGQYVSSMFNQAATYPSGSGPNCSPVPNTTLCRYEMAGYGTLDASIGVARDRWSVELYGTNLTNSHASTLTSSEQFIKSEVPIRPLVVMLKIAAHL